MEFTALQDFYSAETQSHYGKGLSYTVRSPELYPNDKMARERCKTLAALLPKWLADGKVILGRPSTGSVRGG
jgi:hypothetical protein